MERRVNLAFIGYPLYEISNKGVVYSLNYRRSGKECAMKPLKDTKGYYQVSLRNENGRKMFIVHRLVAMAFIPNPNNYPQINHKDENKTNNNVENLEWCTNLYNSRYGTKNERISKTLKGRRVYNLELPVEQLSLDGKHIAFYESQAIAKRVSGANGISNACRGVLKTSGGFTWKYII